MNRLSWTSSSIAPPCNSGSTDPTPRLPQSKKHTPSCTLRRAETCAPALPQPQHSLGSRDPC
eukprot:1159385-Pelagomonas_calceolata.AAC.10